MFLVVYILTFRSSGPAEGAVPHHPSVDGAPGTPRHRRDPGSLSTSSRGAGSPASGRPGSERDGLFGRERVEADFLSVCDYLDKSNIDNILNHMMIPRLLLGTAIAGVASIDAGRASQTARGDQDQWSRTCERIWRAPPRWPHLQRALTDADTQGAQRLFEPHLRAAPSSPGRRVRVRRPLLPDQADLARES